MPRAVPQEPLERELCQQFIERSLPAIKPRSQERASRTFSATAGNFLFRSERALN